MVTFIEYQRPLGLQMVILLSKMTLDTAHDHFHVTLATAYGHFYSIKMTLGFACGHFYSMKMTLETANGHFTE